MDTLVRRDSCIFVFAAPHEHSDEDEAATMHRVVVAAVKDALAPEKLLGRGMASWDRLARLAGASRHKKT